MNHEDETGSKALDDPYTLITQNWIVCQSLAPSSTHLSIKYIIYKSKGKNHEMWFLDGISLRNCFVTMRRSAEFILSYNNQHITTQNAIFIVH